MSSSEATQLLLQAGPAGPRRRDPRARHGRAGAHRRLARDLIRLYGADPDRIRSCSRAAPGEKLYEERSRSEEATKPTPHPKLRIAQAREANRDAVGQMVAWCERDRPSSDAEVRARLKSLDPRVRASRGRARRAHSVGSVARRDGAGCRCARRAARQSLSRVSRPFSSHVPAVRGRAIAVAFHPPTLAPPLRGALEDLQSRDTAGLST
jgi:hypothetical protein